jgi:hypothetical protein
MADVEMRESNRRVDEVEALLGIAESILRSHLKRFCLVRIPVSVLGVEKPVDERLGRLAVREALKLLIRQATPFASSINRSSTDFFKLCLCAVRTARPQRCNSACWSAVEWFAEYPLNGGEARVIVGKVELTKDRDEPELDVGGGARRLEPLLAAGVEVDS